VGQALDELAGPDTHLIAPSPAGAPFTQATARALAAERHLLFACGRYEGIDQRVFEHAATRMRVSEVSLGDYVLFGGEVAVLVVLEAVTRLLPGVLGNADSLLEESHADGVLEAPMYTKPPSWRGSTCRKSSVRATMAGSPGGAVSRRCSGPPSAVPTSWPPSIGRTGSSIKGPDFRFGASMWQSSEVAAG
jgi:tRNA (guanine-N1)-methyltransferase